MRAHTVSNFLLAALVLFSVPFLFALRLGHVELHMAVNRWVQPSFNGLFAQGTHLADGLVPTAIALVFLFVRWRWFLMMAVSVAGSSIIIQLLKHLVFGWVDRPLVLVGHLSGFNLVPGVDMHMHNSFPSGHSTCAFSMCMALAVIIGRPAGAFAWALLAALLAFSRVYLSQHFVEDAVTGAAIGTIAAWATYRWVYEAPFSRKAWLDGSLIRRQNQ
jgi:membrane-associated phospholipid phosphatase